MKITERQINGVTIMDFQGRIANGSARTLLRSKIGEHLERGRQQILLNLGGVDFIDSFALGVLIEVYNGVKNRGGALKLVNLNRQVNQLMVITKLETEIDCFEDEGTAVASFVQETH